jgi:hypothetical protein
MLTTIQVIKKDGGVLTLPIYEPTNFAVMDVQGLDPVKANIVTSNFSQMDGVQYQASRREMRNIFFRIRILSNPGGLSVQDLRKQLYEYLLPKSNVKLMFVQDGTNFYSIEGQVESFDSPIFVKEPEAIISILCFDPDFYEEDASLQFGVSVSNSSVQNVNLEYFGEIDTGFKFTLTATTTVENITLVNNLPDGSVRKMEFVDSPLLISGDVFEVNTVPGNKYVRRIRSNVSTSILYTLSRTSDWLKLYPGVNYIRANSSDTGQVYTIEYHNKYGGL